MPSISNITVINMRPISQTRVTVSNFNANNSICLFSLVVTYILFYEMSVVVCLI